VRFEDFARIHGLIVNNIIPNKSIRTPTEDHPRKMNGAYMFKGDVGFVINWATMDKPAVWFPDNQTTNFKAPNINELWTSLSALNKKVASEQASRKAGWIMHQTKKDFHPYLDKKGFFLEQGDVWHKDGKKILTIPMRIEKRLVGCQLIDDDGNKKFLYGQTTKGAIFTFNAKGFPIFCEGYATALSVREVLKASNIKYCIYVCFSATNMEFVSRTFGNGLIIADNDSTKTGEIVARKTGKPYWLSDTIGEDFNDFHLRVGTHEASRSLRDKLIEIKAV
jgi:putative DNA primase/helicase